MPPRVLWGWEPRTFYEYDDTGRMVSSVTESGWDEDQVELLLAEQYIRNMTGPNGEWMPEATSDGADPNNYDSGYRYAAEGPFTNWVEKTRLDAIDAHKKAAGDKGNVNGLYFTVHKVEF